MQPSRFLVSRLMGTLSPSEGQKHARAERRLLNLRQKKSPRWCAAKSILVLVNLEPALRYSLRVEGTRLASSSNFKFQ
jgi:hypothetical protein